jgi:hypothetical protein
VPKELSENVSRINGSTDVEEPDDIRGNSLTNTLISQCIMSLVEGGMWDGTTDGDHTLVIPKRGGPITGGPLVYVAGTFSKWTSLTQIFLLLRGRSPHYFSSNSHQKNGCLGTSF